MSMKRDPEWKKLFKALNLTRQDMGKLFEKINISVSECQNMDPNERFYMLSTLFKECLPNKKNKMELVFKLVKRMEGTEEEGSEDDEQAGDEQEDDEQEWSEDDEQEWSEDDEQEEDEQEEDEQEEDEHEMQPVAKKQKVCFPSLGGEIVTSRANKPYPRNYHQLPLYGHWFALQVYNIYLSAKELVQAGGDINLDGITIDVKHLCTTSAMINAFCKIPTTENNSIGQGIMATSSLRKAELSYTSMLSDTLSRFLFSNGKGACLHQGPTRKIKPGNPEAADQLYVLYDDFGFPCLPLGCADTKADKMNKAVKTSVYHNVNVVSVQNKYKDHWPLLLSTPNTVRCFEIQLHIPVDKGMWRIPVVSGLPSDKALLCTLYYVVKFLTERDISTRSPLTSCQPLINAKSLKERYDSRVFLLNGKVYKYFEEDSIFAPNLALVQHLPECKLENVTRDGKIKVLNYQFIEGSHEPSTLKQFIFTLQTLCCLHEKGFVHGDIRLCNLVFTSERGYLIDFDLSRKEGSLYPSEYCYKYDVRHPEALPGREMKKIHDRYSISYLIEHHLQGATESILDIHSPLSEVIKEIKELRT